MSDIELDSDVEYEETETGELETTEPEATELDDEVTVELEEEPELNKEFSVDVKIIPEGQGKSINRLTLFEMSEIVSIRAAAIEKGAPSTVDTSITDDPIHIAKEELKNRKCPLLLKRQVAKYTYEIHNPNKMSFSPEFTW